MSLRIGYFDVTNPVGKCEGIRDIKCCTVAVLYSSNPMVGDGDPLLYATLTANAIVWGFGVVAVIPFGVDETLNGGKAVIVYSTEELRKEGAFVQGKTLDEAYPNTTPEGKGVVFIVNVAGEDHIRGDKNCVNADKIGADIPPGSPPGWYDMAGRYCGTDENPIDPETGQPCAKDGSDQNVITHTKVEHWFPNCYGAAEPPPHERYRLWVKDRWVMNSHITEAIMRLEQQMGEKNESEDRF